MPTVDRQAIREHLLDRYHVGRRGTNTGTSQTAITDDANFGEHGGADGLAVGADVRITSGGAPPEDEEARLSSLPALTTGTMNIGPDLSATLLSGDTFELLYRPFTFSRQHSVNGAIDEALNTVLFEKLDVPVTMVPDGDLLKTGDPDSVSGGGDWDIGSLGSLAKRSADFPIAARALRTTNNAVNEFAESASVFVVPGESYYLEVAGRATAASMTARLDLRDVSNGADIDLDNDNSTDQAPAILRNPGVIMPSGCEEVKVRLGGDENNAAIDWYWIIFRKNDARMFTVADRAELTSDTGSPTTEARIEADRLGRLFYYTTHAWGTRGKNKVYVGQKAVMGQAGLWQFHTDGTLGGQSVWYEEFYKPGPLGSDTAVTGLPKEHVAAVAAEILLKPLRSDDRWRDLYTQALLDKQEFIHLYDDQKVIVNEAPRHFSLPTV